MASIIRYWLKKFTHKCELTLVFLEKRYCSSRDYVNLVYNGVRFLDLKQHSQKNHVGRNIYAVSAVASLGFIFVIKHRHIVSLRHIRCTRNDEKYEHFSFIFLHSIQCADRSSLLQYSHRISEICWARRSAFRLTKQMQNRILALA